MTEWMSKIIISTILISSLTFELKANSSTIQTNIEYQLSPKLAQSFERFSRKIKKAKLDHSKILSESIDFYHIFRDSKSVKTVYLPNVIGIGSCGHRAGIVNFPDSNRLAIPDLAFIGYIEKNVSQEAIDIWIFHEVIEALHFRDERYGISAGLGWLVEIEKSDLNWILNSNFFKNVMSEQLNVPCSDQLNNMILAGGSTGVGGGGDPISIELKLGLIRRVYLEYRESSKSEERKNLLIRKVINILNTSIEPDFAGLTLFTSGDTKSWQDYIFAYSQKGGIKIKEYSPGQYSYQYIFGSFVSSYKSVLESRLYALLFNKLGPDDE